MTAHRARSYARHYRAAPTHASTLPAHLAHLHPDWLPPGGYNPDGTYLDPADDLEAPTRIESSPAGLPVEFNLTADSPTRDAPPAPPIPFHGAPTASQTELPVEFNSTAGSSTTLSPAPIPFPTGLPRDFNSQVASPTTPSALGDDPGNSIAERSPIAAAPDASASSVGAHGCAPVSAPGASASPYGALPWFPGSAAPPPDPDGPHAEDEDAIFRNPYIPGNGRETHLSHTALPLRHRIYALHCQGRSISAIARTLRLDRGTVARHLHAVEDLLLAEQTHDLARLRLRAVEAQHAVLAAAWDALLCEELNESDASNDHPYPSRRAQLLATAARAARTAAQLQGLFTPAALAAALRGATVGAQDCAPAAITDPDPTTTPAIEDDPGNPLAELAPRAASDPVGPSAAELSAAHPAASCGMPVCPTSHPAPSLQRGGLPREFNSRACPHHPSRPAGLPVACDSTAGSPTTTADASPIDPAANCRTPASGSPPLAGEGLGERSVPAPSPQPGGSVHAATITYNAARDASRHANTAVLTNQCIHETDRRQPSDGEDTGKDL